MDTRLLGTRYISLCALSHQLQDKKPELGPWECLIIKIRVNCYLFSCCFSGQYTDYFPKGFFATPRHTFVFRTETKISDAISWMLVFWITTGTGRLAIKPLLAMLYVFDCERLVLCICEAPMILTLCVQAHRLGLFLTFSPSWSLGTFLQTSSFGKSRAEYPFLSSFSCSWFIALIWHPLGNYPLQQRQKADLRCCKQMPASCCQPVETVQLLPLPSL